MTEIVWWIFYTLFAVWLQSFIPGADCFGPAVVLCLQTRRYGSLACLLPLWILIQEGAGSLPFGSMLLYYMGLIYFVILVRAYISITSPLYILSLSLAAGLWHWSIIQALSSLQEIHVAMQPLLFQSLRLAALFPVIWALISLIDYSRITPNYARI